LKRRTKKLENDFRLAVIKKYFLEGFKDKISNFVTRGYVRNAKDQIVSELTFVPKIEKNSSVIKISKEMKVNISNIKSQIQYLAIINH